MIKLLSCFPFITFFYLLLVIPASLSAAENRSLPVIVVIGDSLSSAYGMSPEHGWVNLLAKRMSEHRPKWSVTNASITGDTTQGGLTRLPGIIDRHQPGIIIIELGGNDGLRGFDLNTTRNNLQQMVTLSRNNGISVVLLGVRLPPNYGPAYSELFENTYQQLALDENVPLVKYFLGGIAENLELMQPDGIHPAQEAQPLMLENIWPVLKPLLANPQMTNPVHAINQPTAAHPMQ